MMVFDFIRKRAEEGIAQVQNIASKTAEGKLAEALEDTAAYVRQRQEIDAENIRKLSEGLAKSRARLMGDLDSIFGATEDIGLTKTLDKVGGRASHSLRMHATWPDTIRMTIKCLRCSSTSPPHHHRTARGRPTRQLEEVLMMADIGATTTGEIIDDLRAVAKAEQLIEPDDVKSVLRLRLIEALSAQDRSVKLQRDAATTSAQPKTAEGKSYPQVLFVIGANGMGKTTTIGKVCARLKSELNQSVLVAACDTFRAAAVDQLEEWTVRAGVDIHRPAEGQTKPAPVLEDAIARAIEGDYDVLIVDTSGRLSNNVALNEELKKLKRTIAERIPGGPHETLLVLDGAVGRNGVDQAKVWNREVGITGLVITKLDGTARGGVVVSIVRDVGVPVKLIGVGEGITDLRDFDPEVFVDALLGYEPDQAAALEERAASMVKGNLIKPKQGGVLVKGGGGGSGPGADADDIADRMRRRVQGKGGQGGSRPRGSGGGGGKGGKKRKR